MKSAWYSVLVVVGILALPGLALAESKSKAPVVGREAAAQANCQLKMTPREAAGGSLMLSYDARSQEECLKLADPQTEAVYRPSFGQRKRGLGPNE